jgi:hypothetical protein
MLRFLGASALLLTVASTASAGEHYIEVWNPVEARGTVPLTEPSHKQSVHRHAAPRAVKYHARKTPPPMPKLIAKQREAPAGSRRTGPDVTDIPRQITPEGNILRVDSRHAYVGLSR